MVLFILFNPWTIFIWVVFLFCGLPIAIQLNSHPTGPKPSNKFLINPIPFLIPTPNNLTQALENSVQFPFPLQICPTQSLLVLQKENKMKFPESTCIFTRTKALPVLCLCNSSLLAWMGTTSSARTNKVDPSHPFDLFVWIPWDLVRFQ